MATLLCMFVAVGCGSDGSDGAPGKAGDDAVFDETNPKYVELYDKYMDILAQVEGDPDNPGLIAQLEEVTAQLKLQAMANVNQESCAVCHAGGKAYAADHTGNILARKSATERELLNFENPWKATVTNISVDTTTGVATVSFNVKASGSNYTALAANVAGNTVSMRGYYLDANDRWRRVGFTVQAANLTGGAGGNYVAVADAVPTLTVGDLLYQGNRPWTISVYAASNTATPPTGYSNLVPAINAVGVWNAGVFSAYEDADNNPRLYVSDKVADEEASCMRCHGDNFHYYHTYAVRGVGIGVESCFACHSGSNSSDNFAPFNTGNGNTSLVKIGHTIHNSGMNEYKGKDVHTPTPLSDCGLCHTTPEQKDLIYSEDNFYYTLCQTCHQPYANSTVDATKTAWDTMEFGHTAAWSKPAHKNYDATTNCLTCHGDGQPWEFVREKLHRYYDDAAVSTPTSGTDSGKKVKAYTYTDLNNSWKYKYVFDNIAVSGRTVTVDWYVEEIDGGAKFDILDTTNAFKFIRGGSYAPGFTVAYATGDDYTNEGVGSAGAQPQSVSFTTGGTGNTTALGSNVFRTTFQIPTNVDTTIEGRKGLIGIRGIPTIGDASSLYVASNPTQSEPDATIQVVRTTTYAYVDTVTREFNLSNGSVPAELRRETVTFENDCKSCHDHLVGHGHSYVNNVQMCVACHNPGLTDKNGRTTLKGLKDTAGDLANPTLDVKLDGKDEESVDLRYMIHRIHSVSYKNVPYMVYRTRGIYAFVDGFGGVLPAGWGTPADVFNNAAKTGKAGWNEVSVKYPRPTTECSACHTDGFTTAGFAVADLHAAPLTLAQGASLLTQEDDKVLSPTAGACISCHVDAVGTNQIRNHTATNGYFVQLIPGILTKLGLIQAAE